MYDSLEVIDWRGDRSYVGIVQVGMFNANARVVPKIPLEQQFLNLFDSLRTNHAGHGKLLLQIREFRFAELTGSMSERGFCYFRASMYARNNDQYYPVAFIDTLVLVESMEVTKTLMRNSARMVSGFFESSLLLRPDTSITYSLNDIMDIDNYEKDRLPLYTSSPLKDGIYFSFSSFRSQQPDRVAVAEFKKNGTLGTAKAVGRDGKIRKLDREDFYAIVFGGRAFVATEFGYYELTKRNNDLIFIGKAQTKTSAARVAAASMAFGLLGAAIVSAHPSTALFEMKIDHINGGYVQLREIEND